jgi:hypothetical protein
MVPAIADCYFFSPFPHMRFDISLASCDKIPVGTILSTQHNSIISRSLVWHLRASEVENEGKTIPRTYQQKNMFKRLLDGGIVVI